MRKVFYIFTIATLLLTACSKSGSSPSEPDLSITAKTAEINYDETTQMNVNVGSASDYTWTSSDEFVGTVDASGKFTAAHIGETTITAQKDGKTASVDITVETKNDLFVEPLMMFGSSKEEVKAKETRTPWNETDNLVGYKEPSAAIRTGILYVFDDNGIMTSALVPFVESTANATAVGTFYDERYNLIDQDDDLFIFVDKDKKWTVGLYPNQDSFGFSALYIKYSIGATQSAIIKEVLKARKAAAKLSGF